MSFPCSVAGVPGTVQAQVTVSGTGGVALVMLTHVMCLPPAQLEKYEVVPNQIQEKIVGANASKVAA